MLFNLQSNKLRRHLLMGGALCAASLGFFACSDGYDLAERQPTGLNTIYGYMADDGNYKNFLQLIDDLGQKEVLSKTGSKTLFIADDDAFDTFYKTVGKDKWGVTSYDQLTLAQKKMILRASMVDHPYSISMLSSVVGPVEGECMRRTASLQAYDSVLIVAMNDPQIPKTPFWDNLAQTHDSIVLFKDGSGASPMIHFLPRFLAQNMITDKDVDFIYNQPEGTRKTDDAYVNDCKVIEDNIFCKNGFLHKVDKVMLPLDNMAEVIRTIPEMSEYSKLLERFAIPAYDGSTSSGGMPSGYELTRTYNEIKGTDVDSCYQKAYLSRRSNRSNGTTSTARMSDKDGNSYDYALKFDPGWNRYNPGSMSDRDEVMEDMGLMLVPTNTAFDNWWNNGGGKVLQDNYGTIENVPNKVIEKLISNNMQMSFVDAVPSKFHKILNDAAMEMGVKKDSIDHVYLACNGAIYMTNVVYTPMEYSSVLFPALITANMSIIYNAIDMLEYDAYLNSMVSRYSFIIPTNGEMLTYIDPVSLGKSKTNMWKFSYDPESRTEFGRIRATVYECEYDSETDNWIQGDSIRFVVGSGKNDQIYDRLEDMLDNIIVLSDFEPGKSFYQTKGRTFVKTGGTFGVEGQMTIAGGWQLDRDEPLVVESIYRMKNGSSYVTQARPAGTVSMPVYTSRYSTADILAQDPDNFSEFSEILEISGALASSINKASINWSAISPIGNLIYIPDYEFDDKDASVNYLLNTFHYTIYCPTNDAMEYAYSLDHGLPRPQDLYDLEAEIDQWDDYQMSLDKGEDELEIERVDSIIDSLKLEIGHVRKVMLDFIKYHIQDNSIYMDNGFSNGSYETAKTNPNTGRSYTLSVNVNASSLTVKGRANSDPIAINPSKLVNRMGREYWLNNSDPESATMLETSSSVVLHAIDRPLLFKYNPNADLSSADNNQFIYSKFSYDGEIDELAIANAQKRRNIKRK